MKKWKSRLIVILLFGFLCVIALIPMVLTEIENQRFLGKARVEHVPENSMIGREKNINVTKEIQGNGAFSFNNETWEFLKKINNGGFS